MKKLYKILKVSAYVIGSLVIVVSMLFGYQDIPLDDLKEKFGKNVRAMRKKRNCSQYKLAMLTNIDRSYIGRIDRGEVNITLDILNTLAEALECSPVELLP